ncbi:MAG: glycosyltransferase [Solirubrobacterales bacterium]
MSDPRAYEQLFDTQLRREASSAGTARALELEHRIAELTQELSAREVELSRTGVELAELRADQKGGALEAQTLEAQRRAAQRLLEIVTSERDAALREIDRRAAGAAKLEARLVELEAKLEQRAGHDAEAPEVVKQPTLEAAEAKERRTASEYGARIRELEQLLSILAGGLSQTRADIDRAAGSRAWRWGHGATKALRRLAFRRNVTEGALARALKRIEQLERTGGRLPNVDFPAAGELSAPVVAIEPDGRGAEERSADRGALAAEIRKRLGPPPQLPTWPAVSIVVPTREGLDHIERLVAGLEERTDYPDFELIVVDNDSGDGSREFLWALEPSFPLELIANAEPLSFSKSNAQGVERSGHDLILFLNNDVEPFEPGWLRELVAAHRREGVAAVGATLLRSEAGNDPVRRDRTVQHRSVKFRAGNGGVHAFNSGDGEDLFDTGFGIEDRGPAVTAACLLVERSRFEAVSGFGQDYRFGTEDVDLGLNLTANGEAVVATGRSVLYHRESATQDSEGRDFKRNNRLLNRRVFLERWGPKVRREYRLGRLRRDPYWTDGRGPHVAITVTSLDPADGWGDWYTAHEIGEALGALGWRVTYVERKGDRWYDLPEDLDYVLSLMDPFDLRRVPREVTTIIWVRNWTERWLGQPWFPHADVILASSGRSAELIEDRSGRKTHFFPLATNPARFTPRPPEPERTADYVFTGNHWGKERDIQAGIAPREDERLDIYGRGWDEVPEMVAYARGPAPYEDLPDIYSSARLVLDDTSGPTLPYGAVNSRVFDALACGTLALTNCESGARELFGDDFPVWNSADRLRDQIDALLADDELREALARRFRAEVLQRHTYAHRARRLGEILEEHQQKLAFCIKISAPNWEEAQRWGDLHFARAIERELRGRGHPCRIQVLDEWEDADGLSDDIALVIRGLSRHHPKPGQFNILWNISHPDDVTGEECDGYDLVCVASEPFSKTLADKTSTPVIVLEQATDPGVFYPDPSPEYEHDLVYVANSRGVLRPIVRDLLPTDHDLAIYGANWEGLIDTKYVVAEHVPNEELRKVYSSAKIVLCDHWDDMREHGFISNRIYDALACEATVISDDVLGLENRLPPHVRTYGTPAQLESLIVELLSDGSAPDRDNLERHRFSERVDELLSAIDGARDHASEPRRPVGIDLPG